MFYCGNGDGKYYEVAAQEICDAEHAAVRHAGCQWCSDELVAFKVVGGGEEDEEEDEDGDGEQQSTNSNSDSKPQKKKKKKGNKFVTEVDDVFDGTLFHTGYECSVSISNYMLWFYRVIGIKK